MAELNPYPFGALIRRMFRELEASQSIFDLPQRKFFVGDPAHDVAVRFHGLPASSPLGPAAGPQSQMAQNIVLSWLAGCRIIELKTVQIIDTLEIPRPCIDMQTIGYNVEWSQELRLAQSLDEYVKASMLIDMLVASGVIPLEPGFDNVMYDMSVGYDLAGIQSPQVQAFIEGMKDAGEVVERFRAEIPDEFARFRDLDFRTHLSDTLTLSTFHGCPPDEIERIIDFLLKNNGLNCIVKLNPTLLGPDVLRPLLTQQLGYEEVVVPDSAFENDTKWHQVEAFVQRLGDTAESLNLGFGVKFTNTLICHNHRDFFPGAEKEMYASGQPLHVLAMNLVQRFRKRFGDTYPISFSAGIERKNFPDAVALGLVPITVCSDFCRPGGYGRAKTYFRELAGRMDKVGASDIDTFILKAYGHAEAALQALQGVDEAWREGCRAALAADGDLRAAAGDEARFAAWVSAAKLLNTDTYVPTLSSDTRYSREGTKKVPRKLGSMLELFDCVTCDKCIPVCPNDANFTLVMPPMQLPIWKAAPEAAGFKVRREGELELAMKHQIANFADFCNECGNCDVFCPEDGGPYILKPRFFGSLEQWRTYPDHDGFYLERQETIDRVWGRFEGADFEVEVGGARARYAGAGFEVTLDPADPAGSLQGRADAEFDLTYFAIMDALRRAIFDAGDVNWVNALS